MKRVLVIFLTILFFLSGCRADVQTGNEVSAAGQSFSSADMVAFKCRFVSEDNYTGEEGIGSAEYYFELKVLDDGRIEAVAPHEELLKLSENYRYMNSLQIKGGAV